MLFVQQGRRVGYFCSPVDAWLKKSSRVSPSSSRQENQSHRKRPPWRFACQRCIMVSQASALPLLESEQGGIRERERPKSRFTGDSQTLCTWANNNVLKAQNCWNAQNSLGNFPQHPVQCQQWQPLNSSLPASWLAVANTSQLLFTN